MNTSFSSDGQKSVTMNVKEINDLDHGPDKLIYIFKCIIFQHLTSIIMKQDTNYKNEKHS